jgi:hypothetical protein
MYPPRVAHQKKHTSVSTFILVGIAFFLFSEEPTGGGLLDRSKDA